MHYSYLFLCNSNLLVFLFIYLLYLKKTNSKFQIKAFLLDLKILDINE